MIVSTTAVAAVALAAGALWAVSVVVRDVSIIDVLWGPAFGIVAWAAAYDRGFALAPPQWGLVALVTIWGARLGGYLAWRNLGHSEDPRYAKMRERAGARFVWTSLLTVFGLQAALVCIISVPVQAGLQATAPAWSVWYVVGAVSWAIGLYFEAVGDLQLARFKADPANRGRVLETGLWRYTRHPNYFGDFMVWWGVFVFALGAGAPVWTVVGPVIMSVLLMKVSGVPLLEKDIAARRPGYVAYVARTSAFFPRPPRKAP